MGTRLRKWCGQIAARGRVRGRSEFWCRGVLKARCTDLCVGVGVISGRGTRCLTSNDYVKCERSWIPRRVLRIDTFRWDDTFDGIWACVSLLRVARADLSSILDWPATVIRTGCVSYASFKHVLGERPYYGMVEDLLLADLDATHELTLSGLRTTPDPPTERQRETWHYVQLKPTD